ncbi:MAG: efflux RND transporter periplasmic adaptor subunit [Cytophagales bacterium]|jgi:membrane fusion protein (multidrug efflux system)|nr:efflux RND transporter periplasmic adaptor subunit [Cytophagales bacterium]MCA6378701.1 efflux RND transporter periplasmic adaptor subunit [Cytophagales bacterium]MCA6387744.1 efflux RND transporter periplasmic adaptor subunit [Cytophagales bacterium]MCA6390595.1 efflux RND transporter periplasmic adaptor subunit [Cytophagales bacterium]MCA6395175.1 efflux RND transporter periplasmic adaptor subunit [Cytophagales bacterium]
MKSKLYSKLLALLVIAIVVAACNGSSKDKETQLKDLKAQQAALATQISELEKGVDTKAPASGTRRSKEVGVIELTPRPFDHYIKTQGAIEAVDNILVSAKTMGVITQVFVREGDVVSKGQTLAQIDNSLTMRGMEEVKSGLDLATTIYNRQKNLWDQKIGTEVQYLQAKNNKESLERRLATMKEQLDMALIKSPISGSVDAVDVKIGQNAAPGAPAFRVVSSDRLKFIANVSEAYVTDVKKGNKVQIAFSDLNKSVGGQVTFVGKAINQLSRTFPVEIALTSNSDFRPNMSGELKLIFHSEPAAIVVPVNVVQDINGQKVVYTAETVDGKLVAKKNIVTVIGVYGNLAHVNTLKKGDKVITVGYQGLNEGELIKI